MPTLFQTGFIGEEFSRLTSLGATWIENLPEDDFLERSVDDLVASAIAIAMCRPLRIETSAWADGGVVEVKSRERGMVTGRPVEVRHLHVWAEFSFEGNERLFQFRPSSAQTRVVEATIRPGERLRVEHTLPPVAQAGQNVTVEQAKGPIDSVIGTIANNVDNANRDAENHNLGLDGKLRPIVEDRRERILNRRDLQGQLGFPVIRRDDAPRTVPLERQILGIERRSSAPAAHRRSYRDEYALDEADYEDVISVITGMLRAFERTPSVTDHRDEEFLRDLLLVALNGTYKGTATGETFVKTGKTDLLVRVEDRHVFVGECKWWNGPQSASDAVDQLLGYLPWRDEKGALIFFIDRVNASAVLDAAEEVVMEHPAYKRTGVTSSDLASRRNYVLGHPNDPDREIRLALLFAVIYPRSSEVDRSN